MKRKIIAVFFMVSFIFNYGSTYAINNVYPNLSDMYLNIDKYEKLNRKIFNYNLKMNKIFVKNIHILWASLFPEFMVNALNRAYLNIEYPKRLISSLLQRDFESVKNESKRFLINSTIGLGGLFDPAKSLFHLEFYDEDMEQALAKCKMKCGSYLVMPFISSTTSRDITGRIFDFLLTPTTYIMTPVAAAIKMGLLINRTMKIQPVVKLVESGFADPYDVAKKVYGVEKYIKLSNLDRKNVIEKYSNDYDELDLVDNKTKENLSVKGKVGESDNLYVRENLDDTLKADIILENFNPQYPILDSMRTALLDINDKNKSIWNEISIWNRNFSKKVKTAQIEISPNRDKYKIRYVLQKDKKSPLAVIFPSVAEGVNSSHNTTLAEIFYDEGYSVLILGSHFQWEFLKSIEKGHNLGIISEDIKYINLLINNSIKYLSEKYDRTFLKRTAFGTSLGAYAVLFLADNQYRLKANNIDKFIAVCPPYDLIYAINQMDKIIASWKNYPDDLAKKAALTSSKVIQAYKNKDELNKNFKALPFSNYEAKLISAFVFHQKLGDLIYQIELDNDPNKDKKEIYSLIYDMNFTKYMQKYFVKDVNNFDELKEKTSFNQISDYLKNASNYKIYHSLDDYLTEYQKLKHLKKLCAQKLTLFDSGSHLGFLYRNEFINDLKNEIRLK